MFAHSNGADVDLIEKSGRQSAPDPHLIYQLPAKRVNIFKLTLDFSYRNKESKASPPQQDDYRP